MQYLDCSYGAQTQAAMNACAEEFACADTELNHTYRALPAKTAQQPETAAKIKFAQKSWLAFRDAYVEAMFPAADKQTEYSSMSPCSSLYCAPNSRASKPSLSGIAAPTRRLAGPDRMDPAGFPEKTA
jgi:uncharacterized protein YecT (DUF1311 family)